MPPSWRGRRPSRADLRAALLDDSIAGRPVASGGYGSQRTLEVLDWTGLDEVAPKVVVGLLRRDRPSWRHSRRLGWSSLMGPMVAEGEFAESYSFSLADALPDGAGTRCGPLRFDTGVTVVGGSAEGVRPAATCP